MTTFKIELVKQNINRELTVKQKLTLVHKCFTFIQILYENTS